MKKIKFAIVGCGSIGKRHIAVLDAEPEAEIVAICDIDNTKANEQSNLYNGIKIYNDYAVMLNEIDADIINVVTPHHLHATQLGTELLLKPKKKAIGSR